MKYRWASCSKNLTPEDKAAISRISGQAFKSIPTSEIEKRIENYDRVILFYVKKEMVGFFFVSLHKTEDYFLVGVRLTGFLPEYQNKGISRRAIPIVFYQVAIPYLVKNLFRRDQQPMVMFCRLCNPFAYLALSCGQTLYPDLIRSSSKELPEEAKPLYRQLKKELSLKNLNVETGIIFEGAQDAGIVSTGRQLRNQDQWQTPWSEYVTRGSELLVSFPITGSTILIMFYRFVIVQAKGAFKSIRDRIQGKYWRTS
jgi:hypothetical protein